MDPNNLREDDYLRVTLLATLAGHALLLSGDAELYDDAVLPHLDDLGGFAKSVLRFLHSLPRTPADPAS